MQNYLFLVRTNACMLYVSFNSRFTFGPLTMSIGNDPKHFHPKSLFILYWIRVLPCKTLGRLLAEVSEKSWWNFISIENKCINCFLLIKDVQQGKVQTCVLMSDGNDAPCPRILKCSEHPSMRSWLLVVWFSIPNGWITLLTIMEMHMRNSWTTNRLFFRCLWIWEILHLVLLLHHHL